MTTKIRLDYLATYIEVYDRGSLLSAAEKLGTSVSTVSTQIDAVETYYKAKLFKRTASGVKSTKEGKIVYANAKEVLRNIEETKRFLSSLDSKHIDVASGCLGIPLIAELKTEYSKIHPDLGFSIELHGTRACFKLLDEGEVSLIFAGYIPKEISRERYHVAELGKDKLVLITPPDHVLSSQDVVTIEDVKNTALVMVSEEEDIAKRIKLELTRLNISTEELRVSGVMDSIFAQIYGVVSGFGCAITSNIHAKRFAEAGLITIKDVKELFDERSVLLICSKKSLENPDVKQLVDFASKIWGHSKSN